MLCFYGKDTIDDVVGRELIGYDKKRICIGSKEKLEIQLLVFDDGKKTALIVIETLCVDNNFVTMVKSIGKKYHVDHCIVCATHSHSTPSGLNSTLHFGPVFGSYDEQFTMAMLNKIDNLFLKIQWQQCTVSQAKVSIEGVSSNRQGRDFESVMNLFSIAMETKIVHLVHYPCHPTVYSSDNCFCSSDLFGAFKQRCDDEVIVVNGAAGDLSTRFTRSGVAENDIDVMSLRLFEGFTKAYHHRIHCVSSCRVYEKTFTLKAKKNKTMVAKDTTSQMMEETIIRLNGDVVELSCVVWQFCGFTYLCVPCELCSHLLFLLENESDVIGYCNGYELYVADKLSYDCGYYEACSSKLAYGEAEKWMIECKDWIVDIKKGRC